MARLSWAEVEQAELVLNSLMGLTRKEILDKRDPDKMSPKLSQLVSDMARVLAEIAEEQSLEEADRDDVWPNFLDARGVEHAATIVLRRFST